MVQKGDEENWEGVEQELMSNEEDFDDGFKIKSPSHWRTDELNSFIKELDQRLVGEKNKTGKRAPLRKKELLANRQ